jgi:hypothetical protein
MKNNDTNIEDELIRFLGIYIYQQLNQEYEIEYFTHDGIEFYIYDKSIEDDSTSIIRVLIYHHTKQVLIPTIFIPKNIHHRGIGKYMIKIIYEVSKQFNYEVLVVDLVDSFRDKLLRRGALQTSEYDTLKINENTNLL